MLKCKGYKVDCGTDGYEYECGYETAVDCGECIMTGGNISPQTGKVFRGNLKKYQDLARERSKMNNK